jgi:hypothetical protein
MSGLVYFSMATTISAWFLGHELSGKPLVKIQEMTQSRHGMIIFAIPRRRTLDMAA